MKKFILPLLLLLAVGMLAAVESDPSDVVGYLKYPCVAGLNLVALPMDSGYTLASEVIAAYNTGDEIDTVFMWNADFQIWDYTQNQGGNYFDPDFAVAPGSVLYFNTSTGFDFYSMGPLPVANANYPVVAGLNLVMVPLNRSDCVLGSQIATEVGVDQVDTIFMWNPLQVWDYTQNQGGDYFDPDFALNIGTPVYFNSAVTGVWPPALAKTDRTPLYSNSLKSK
ncbi:MAG: hypothetical protein PHO32_05275 [Candidatus Cloacimonetes bacterium]|nr:hypothetical protein [Candidatus Cloacimonadota bacterium]